MKKKLLPFIISALPCAVLADHASIGLGVGSASPIATESGRTLPEGRISTGYLYCPRCGLRKPKNEIFGYYGGYCPSCGTRMVDEGSLPFTSKKVKYTRQPSYYLLKKGMTNKCSSYV